MQHPRRRTGTGHPGAPARANLELVVEQFLRELGAYADDPELLDIANTPKRVAKMYMEELLSSYKEDALTKLKAGFTMFPTGASHEMVTVGPIAFTSLCAHHLLPFAGQAHVGYIPNERLVGLSKIPRTVEFFSRKLQLQERLTTQIADFLETMLEPQGLIVLLEARHQCMECRGVKTPAAVTRTSALRGEARAAEVKSEFYYLLSRSG